MKKVFRISMLLLMVLFILCACGEKKTEQVDEILADGTYFMEVELEGGSGKAKLQSPCEVNIKNGEMTATIEWSSPYYDFMIVNGDKINPINTDGNSVFILPVIEENMSVQADTIAMSQPHLIDYTIHFKKDTITSSK